MYKQVLKGNCDIVLYRRYRNFCGYIVARAKITYYHNSFRAHLSNMKQTWKQINNIIKPNRVKRVKINLNDGDALVDDNKEVSNIFNNYFAEVASNLNMNIPVNNKDPLDYLAMNPLSFMCDPTSPNEITAIIDSMRK